MAGGEEHRREQRVPSTLQVDLGNQITGVTRNVSASGIFFETDALYDRGSVITFDIHIDTPGGAMVLSCRGEIVRIEQREAKLGVAVRISESVLRPPLAADATARSVRGGPRQDQPGGLGNDEQIQAQ